MGTSRKVKLWSKDELAHPAIKLLFQGVPKGDEYYQPDFVEMEMSLQRNPSYASYLRGSSLSDDGMAYTTPWYTHIKKFYDEDADIQNRYRGFVYSIWNYFGIRIASMFFTKNFKKHVDINNPKMLASVERVFFDSPYVGKWT